MDNNRALSISPKLWIPGYTPGLVGEHSKLRRSRFVRSGGVFGKANVGISNDKGGEKPPRR